MPADAAEIVRLAERVEQAVGPDRELDGWIWWMTGALAALCPETADMPAAVAIGYYSGRPPRLEESELTVADVTPAYQCPAYTASLDAAMTLVPADHTVQLSDWDHPTLREKGPWQAIVLPFGARGSMKDYTFTNRCDHATTPALALTAAALRARAAQHDHEVG